MEERELDREEDLPLLRDWLLDELPPRPLLCFSCSFFLLALILARKNSYRPFCSQPSLFLGRSWDGGL